MRTAFRKVCDALWLKCDKDDPMTEVIVTKIVALAKAGEHDADRLTARVLDDLADAGAPTDRDMRPEGVDFDRDPEARRRFMEDAPQRVRRVTARARPVPDATRHAHSRSELRLFSVGAMARNVRSPVDV
jgi:hypothetical protein